jgi:hypothetical protein
LKRELRKPVAGESAFEVASGKAKYIPAEITNTMANTASSTLLYFMVTQPIIWSPVFLGLLGGTLIH